jgi:SPP1 family predicted phage head-tail adaptor
MSDAIGALRWRIELQQPTLTPDDIGGGARGFATVATVWAQVRALSHQPLAFAEGLGAASLYRCEIRMRRDVRAGWRVRRGARAFRVLSIADADEKGARLILTLEEELL